MTELMEDCFDNFCAFIQNLVSMFIQFILQGVLVEDGFVPKIDIFQNSFGGSGSFNVILEFFMKVGAVLLFTLLGIRILILLLGNVVEIRDSILTTVIRLVVCIALIMGVGTLGLKIMEVGDNLAREVTTSFGNLSEIQYDASGRYGAMGSSATLKNVQNIVNEHAQTTLSIIEDSKRTVKQGESGDNSGISYADIYSAMDIQHGQIALEVVSFVFRSIVRVVFFCILAWNLIKLVVEMVQRYVTMMALYIGMPCGCAFFISSDTQNVFFSYMKMFIAQVFVLVFTRAWIGMSFFLMSTLASNVVNMFLMIAFIRVGLRLEGIFKELGLSIGNMGANLLDNVAMTAGIMGMALARGKNAAGRGLISAGALAGSSKMARAGNFLTGRPLDAQSVSKSMEGSVGGQVRQTIDSKGQNDFTRAYKNSDTSAMSAAFASTPVNQRQKLAQNAVDTMFNGGRLGEGTSDRRLRANGVFDSNQGIGVDVVNGKGQKLASGFISNRQLMGAAAKTGISSPITDAMGAQKYLNIANAPKSLALGSISTGQMGSGMIATADLLSGRKAGTLDSFQQPKLSAEGSMLKGANGALQLDNNRANYGYVASGISGFTGVKHDYAAPKLDGSGNIVLDADKNPVMVQKSDVVGLIRESDNQAFYMPQGGVQNAWKQVRDEVQLTNVADGTPTNTAGLIHDDDYTALQNFNVRMEFAKEGEEVSVKVGEGSSAQTFTAVASADGVFSHISDVDKNSIEYDAKTGAIRYETPEKDCRLELAYEHAGDPNGPSEKTSLFGNSEYGTYYQRSRDKSKRKTS